jgi:hypothetical protein
MPPLVRAALTAQILRRELFMFFFFLGKLEFSPAKVAQQLRSVSFCQVSYNLLGFSGSTFLFPHAYFQRRRHDQYVGQHS